MRRAERFALGLLGPLLLLTGCWLDDVIVDRVPPEDVRAAHDARIRELIETAGIPGLAIAVVVDGELDWTGHYGVESVDTGDPVSADTVFEAASLTKPVFAYAVLRLVERGELDLGRPLHELLEYERFGGVDRARQLTPRLVLSHQTGLPNWGGDVLEFGFEPGTAFGYSGEGYVYLQRVVEAQTGLTLDQLVRREVLEPLGMTNSRLEWSLDESFRFADGHDEAGRAHAREPREPEAAGSLLTTATDYARFLIAMMAAEGLQPATVETVLSPAIMLTGAERGAEGTEAIAGRLGWGLGWGVQRLDDGRIVWHWGDNGIFKAFVAARPERRDGVVYFANSEHGLAVARAIVEPVVGEMAPTFAWLGYDQVDDPGWTERRAARAAEEVGDYPTAIELLERALEADPGDAESARRAEWLRELMRVRSAPVEIPAARLGSYAGRYGPRTLTVDEGVLVYQREGRDPYRLIPIGEDTFALDGMVDFRLRVITEPDGRASRLVGLYVGGDQDESERTD